MAITQKTAIVTGASQGIGAGVVEAFLQRDYRVVANSRNITNTNPFPATEAGQVTREVPHVDGGAHVGKW